METIIKNKAQLEKFIKEIEDKDSTEKIEETSIYENKYTLSDSIFLVAFMVLFLYFFVSFESLIKINWFLATISLFTFIGYLFIKIPKELDLEAMASDETLYNKFINEPKEEAPLLSVKEKLYKAINFGYRFPSISFSYILKRIFALGVMIVGKFVKPSMNSIHLKNKEGKEIEFQQMVHIASPKFYESVKENMNSFIDKRYTVYYEQVKGKDSPKESNDLINKILWLSFSPWKEFYWKFATLFWYVGQDYDKIFDKDYSGKINADATPEEMIREYELRNWISYKIDKPTEKERLKSLKLEKALEEFEKEINNPSKIKIIKELNQSFYKGALKILLKISTLKLESSGTDEKIKMFHIIDDFRNKIVVENFISSSETNKLFIIYGGAHFKWIFKLLKEQDSSWEITKVSEFHPMD